MERRRVKRGDTARRRWRLLQRDGKPIVLTGATVKLILALAPGQAASGVTSLNAACTVEDAAEGVVREPAGGLGALSEALYRAEFQVTYGDGQVETVPDEGWQLVEVIAELGS